jgi:hypothetical protein
MVILAGILQYLQQKMCEWHVQASSNETTVKRGSVLSENGLPSPLVRCLSRTERRRRMMHERMSCGEV